MNARTRSPVRSHRDGECGRGVGVVCALRLSGCTVSECVRGSLGLLHRHGSSFLATDSKAPATRRPAAASG
eukprot:3512266-Rhodomonas_salina.2